MSKFLFIYLLFLGVMFADDSSNNTDNVIYCNKIFEQRKNEIVLEVQNLEQQKRLMTSLYEEQQAINDKKLQNLKLQEQKIDTLLKEAADRENEIKELIKQNEELLENIKNAKNDKITQTYAKMRDSKAGAIIENMPLKEAAELLFSMDSKDMSKILSKMTPQRAAQLTEMLKSGPPFEDVE